MGGVTSKEAEEVLCTVKVRDPLSLRRMEYIPSYYIRLNRKDGNSWRSVLEKYSVSLRMTLSLTPSPVLFLSK